MHRWSAPIPPTAGTTELLAVREGSATYSPTANVAQADLDATNLTATITVPASGRLLVRLSATAYLAGTDTTTGGLFGIRDASTNLVTGRMVTSTTAHLGLVKSFLITGLTPAASQVIRFAVRSGSQAMTVENPVMEIWAA